MMALLESLLVDRLATRGRIIDDKSGAVGRLTAQSGAVSRHRRSRLGDQSLDLSTGRESQTNCFLVRLDSTKALG